MNSKPNPNHHLLVGLRDLNPVSDQRAEGGKLNEQVTRDPLTGIFNRLYREATIGRELAKASRKGSSIGIVMIDIDYFFVGVQNHDIIDILSPPAVLIPNTKRDMGKVDKTIEYDWKARISGSVNIVYWYPGIILPCCVAFGIFPQRSNISGRSHQSAKRMRDSF